MTFEGRTLVHLVVFVDWQSDGNNKANIAAVHARCSIGWCGLLTAVSCADHGRQVQEWRSFAAPRPNSQTADFTDLAPF